MTNYPRQALVGDIGHTAIRLAITDIDELTIANYAVLQSHMFSGPQEAIRAYLKTVPDRPTMAGFAAAGSVVDGVATIPGLGWSFTTDDLRAASSAMDVRLVNDFEAIALALPYLTDHDLHRISGGVPAERAARVVLGPGTGLGVAGLIWSAGGWVAVAGDGGKTSFSAQSNDDIAFLKSIGAQFGHVPAERVISSGGLADLYQWIAAQKKAQVPKATAADVVKKAHVDHDPLAQEALNRFVGWLGQFAADMALVYGASGGIYLGGGMAPKLLEALSGTAFRNALQAKGAYLPSIPVYVIKAADAGLRGAAVALSTNPTAAVESLELPVAV